MKISVATKITIFSFAALCISATHIFSYKPIPVSFTSPKGWPAPAYNFSGNPLTKEGIALGKKLLLRVKDMLDTTHRPAVVPTASIKEVIMEISEKRLGVTAVLEDNKVIGIITDGDIRRMLNNNDSFTHLVATDIMTKNPKNISSDTMVVDALNILENNAITQLVVIDNEKYQGILHLHDILKEGIV